MDDNLAAEAAYQAYLAPEHFPDAVVCMAQAMTVYGYSWADSIDVADYMMSCLEDDGYRIKKQSPATGGFRVA